MGYLGKTVLKIEFAVKYLLKLAHIWAKASISLQIDLESKKNKCECVVVECQNVHLHRSMASEFRKCSFEVEHTKMKEKGR